jgi:hypothetical protein
MAWREVIVSLNSLGVGDLEGLQRKLAGAREEVVTRGETELADKLDEAAAALEDGRFADYRRLVSLVVSRLGHLRD